MRIFFFVINTIYWLWIFLAPTIVFGLIGFFLYSSSAENLPYLIFLTIIGMALGILWAERIRKKHGLTHFFSNHQDSGLGLQRKR